MGNVGGGEIVVILLVALLILGPAKLPEAARQVGRAMGELRKVTSGFQRELQDALKDTAEPVAATRPVAAASTPTATTAPDDAPTPSTEPVGTESVTMEDAAAQIPPAPAPVSDELSPAPGSDH